MKNTINKEGFLPKITRIIAEKSINSTCVGWIGQPRVPEAMKNKQAKK